VGRTKQRKKRNIREEASRRSEVLKKAFICPDLPLLKSLMNGKKRPLGEGRGGVRQTFVGDVGKEGKLSNEDGHE